MGMSLGSKRSSSSLFAAVTGQQQSGSDGTKRRFGSGITPTSLTGATTVSSNQFVFMDTDMSHLINDNVMSQMGTNMGPPSLVRAKSMQGGFSIGIGGDSNSGFGGASAVSQVGGASQFGKLSQAPKLRRVGSMGNNRDI